ncbi:MAG: MurT ligase domain-containing protein [Clostridia bacterium]|nr:MurT ligase domain-containing protein [Clostridia bacterium]
MSNKIKFYFAMLAAKSARVALRMLGRQASCTPGIIALKLCPDFLGHLKMPPTTVCVTGTNGKTTTSNLIASVLTDCGYSVTNNSYGSNIQAGVTSALIADSTFTGKPKKEIAVLEVDERSSLLVYKYITPDILICNNIMRDSLKRNAHTEFISFIINKAVPASTKLVLNADDIICSRLAPQNKDRVYFGMEAEIPQKSAEGMNRDITYCPECGSLLVADYIRYNHIGRVHCSECDLCSPDRDFTITDIDRGNLTFTVSHDGKEEKYKLVNDNLVNIYNCCGAVAVLTLLGLSYEQISKSFDKQKIVSSRFDRFTAGKLNVIMQLAKGQNPIACSRAFSYVVSYPGLKKSLLIMTDDKSDNTNNSESTCWLYDCDYSALTDPSIDEIIFAGKRCRDQRLRALLAGVDGRKIKITDDAASGADYVDTDNHTDICVLYDPYILAEADVVKQKLIEKGGKAL